MTHRHHPIPFDISPAPSDGGFVSIVGAGPGAADLLTLRAYFRLQQADVVVYDRLIDDSVMALIPEATEKHYAGKAAERHHLHQPEIHDLLVKLAQEGKHVVRLKGGDPFIFGRGGEELEAIAEHSIPYEVVPGITAAQGCAAMADIPLTHRDHASSCVFLPGHLSAEKEQHSIYKLNWASLAQPAQTLVFYMAIKRIQPISQALFEHGLPPETPAAIIQNGTRQDQKIWAMPLHKLIEHAPDYTPKPGLFIVGSVVSMSTAYQPK